MCTTRLWFFAPFIQYMPSSESWLERHMLFNICLAPFLAIISCQRQGLAFGNRFLPQTCVPASRVIASGTHLCLWPGHPPKRCFCGGHCSCMWRKLKPATDSPKCDLQTSRARCCGCCLKEKEIASNCSHHLPATLTLFHVPAWNCHCSPRSPWPLWQIWPQLSLLTI